MMRRYKVGYLTVLSILAVLTLAPPIMAEVLLSTDFESDTGELPAGWGAFFGAVVWRQNIMVSADQAYDGSQSLKIVDSASDQALGLRSRLIDADDTSRYRVSVQLFNEQRGDGTVYLEFWDDRGQRIAHHIAAASTRLAWDEVVLEAQAPQGTTHVTVLLYSSGPVIGTAYFDHVVLERLPADADGTKVVYKQFPVASAVHLGTPITWNQQAAGAFGMNAQGEPVWYFTSPASGSDLFYMVRVTDGKLLGRYPFPGGGLQAWAVLPLENGDVYFSAGAALFKFHGETGRIDRLGLPHPTSGMIWDLAQAPDGMIYGATYPHARVFALDPQDDVFVDVGPMSDAEYARSIAVSDDYVFVGIGPGTDIVAYHRESGELTSSLPERYKGRPGFVRYMDVRGNRLFASAGDDTNEVLIYDTDTLELIQSIHGITTPVSDIAPDGGVYFRLGSAPYRYDLATDKFRQAALAQPVGKALGFAEIDPSIVPESRRSRFTGVNLVGLQQDKYWVVNLKSRQMLEVPIDVQPTPIRVHSLGATEGLVYGGGIAPGGMFIRNPETGEHTIVEPIGQVDSLLLLDGKVYFGTYPGAYVRMYDPASGEFTTFGQIGHDQDRPMAIAEQRGRIYFGTIPDYGLTGGALALFDPQTNRIRTWRNVVPEHSIVSLAVQGDVLYFGTSTMGGLGAERVAGDAVLGAWDTETDTLLWTKNILPGEGAIGGMTLGADGLLWGAGSHSLFAFDPTAGEIVWTYRLRHASQPAYDWTGAHAVAYDRYVVIAFDRQFLAVIDTTDRSLRVAQGGYDYITIDHLGNLYYNNLAILYMLPPHVWMDSGE